MGDICSRQKHWLRAMNHPSRALRLSGWMDRTMGLDEPECTAGIIPFVRKVTVVSVPIPPIAPGATSHALVLGPADYAAHEDYIH